MVDVIEALALEFRDQRGDRPLSVAKKRIECLEAHIKQIQADRDTKERLHEEAIKIKRAELLECTYRGIIWDRRNIANKTYFLQSKLKAEYEAKTERHIKDIERLRQEKIILDTQWKAQYEASKERHKQAIARLRQECNSLAMKLEQCESREECLVKAVWQLSQGSCYPKNHQSEPEAQAQLHEEDPRENVVLKQLINTMREAKCNITKQLCQQDLQIKCIVTELRRSALRESKMLCEHATMKASIEELIPSIRNLEGLFKTSQYAVVSTPSGESIRDNISSVSTVDGESLGSLPEPIPVPVENEEESDEEEFFDAMMVIRIDEPPSRAGDNTN